MPDEPQAIRNAYAQVGVETFYREQGARYRNPHEDAIRLLLRQIVSQWKPDTSRVLDLACGSGEVTLALRELGAGDIAGVDPFTFEAYAERTGQSATQLSFEQVAGGALSEQRFSLVVCSFALHLASPSWLPLLCFQLAQISGELLVLTPHKRPHLLSAWGWKLVEETEVERVRARFYRRVE